MASAAPPRFPPARYKAPVVAYVRIVLAVVLGVALIAAPLLLLERYDCRRQTRKFHEWALVEPLGEKPRFCRNPKNGAEQLIEFARGG